MGAQGCLGAIERIAYSKARGLWSVTGAASLAIGGMDECIPVDMDAVCMYDGRSRSMMVAAALEVTLEHHLNVVLSSGRYRGIT